MEELLAYRKKLLLRLQDNVAELRQLAAARPPEAWQVALPGDGRTPHQVVAHLRSIEAQAMSLRLRRILDEDEPFLDLFHDDAWQAEHYQAAEPLANIIEEYARLRAAELSWLQDLPSAGWNRTGRHPWYGVRTLQWWVERCWEYAEEHLDLLR
jgi:hypothetical protein